MTRRRIFLIGLAVMLSTAVASGATLVDDPMKYVNPNIGTMHSRWFFYTPAAVPFGMAKLTPSTNGTKGNEQGWEAVGYEDQHTSIDGFPCLHEFQIGGIALMPITGAVRTIAGSMENPDEGFRSRFDKWSEQAMPGYYSVRLTDYNVRTELTATDRVGFYRFTFDGDDEGHILFNIGNRQGESGAVRDAFIRREGHTVRGYVVTEPEYVKKYQAGATVGMFFYAVIDQEPLAARVAHEGGSLVAGEEIRGTGAMMSLDFKTKAGETVVVKVGLSYTSMENAQANLEAEGERLSFDKARRQAEKRWREALQRIRVKGGSVEDRTKFYTGLYHALLGRGLASDVNGAYPRNDGSVGFVNDHIQGNCFNNNELNELNGLLNCHSCGNVGGHASQRDTCHVCAVATLGKATGRRAQLGNGVASYDMHNKPSPNKTSTPNTQHPSPNKTSTPINHQPSPHVNTDALWGAYWNLTQLWGLAYPEYYNNMVATQLRVYRDAGWLGDGIAASRYVSGVGTNMVSIALAAAWQNGIRDYDVETAYEAALKNETGWEGRIEGAGKMDTRQFVRLGYVPQNDSIFFGTHPGGSSFSASHTLEYSFSAYAVAQWAKALGRDDDYQRLMDLSRGWERLFDDTLKMIRPRNADGRFIDNFDPLESWRGFQEGNAMQYTFFVPHQPEQLIRRIGQELFCQRLDSIFTVARQHVFGGGKTLNAFSGLQSPYNHGNQPCLHIAWLFNYADRPWLTQKWTRLICNEFYGTTPEHGYGYGQDEDQGQLGAWYVMAAMGLFDVKGGTETDAMFQIGSPLFDRIEISLSPVNAKGKKFVIETIGNGPDCYYIKEAKLNGVLLDRMAIPRSAVYQGGKLQLRMETPPYLPEGEGSHVAGSRGGTAFPPATAHRWQVSR